MNIEERIAVVTGGASGLGEATVKQLVSDGARKRSQKRFL